MNSLFHHSHSGDSPFLILSGRMCKTEKKNLFEILLEEFITRLLFVNT